jgi:capsular polysaccharide biosynthesis protein
MIFGSVDKRGFGWLRRRGWWLLPAATLLAATAAYWAARPGPPTYTAESTLLVQSGAGINDPGTATEAIRLAGTYALLIPEDTRIQQAISKELGVPPQDVADSLTAFNGSGTALIRLTYETGDPETAVKGVNAAARAVSGVPPASPSIASGITVVSSVATSASSSTRGMASAVPVGALLGLGISILALMAWERSDARIEDEQALARELDTPASRLDMLSMPSARVLVERWSELATQENPRIALIACAGGAGAEVRAATWVLAQQVKSSGARISVRSLAELDLVKDSSDVILVAGGAPGPAESGETVARSCGATVVVCLTQTRVSDLRASLTVLDDFGIQPVWGLLVDRRTLRSSDFARRSMGRVSEPLATAHGNIAHAGVATTGAPHTGAPHTGITKTGANHTGITKTGAPNTGTANTGATNTGVTKTGAPDTGTANTGATNTGVTKTGAPDTGSANAGVTNGSAANTNAANASVS